ncbi:endonuclease/exonuclease/phosphatase family protein [Noviherbaspirillum malthae]|uniref:endonuclease/exonuclease/phosphatase family protein n=1 Tax=Noviherbaspirillum malthae TaxID=1260987 RepID=UPI001890B460|nr:endonuclease/exonuclease/phosphatase family protein [Noviherbaspirillum malthae]
MSFAVILTLTAVLVTATLLPLSRSTHWWVRDLDFPRLQIAAAGLALLAAELFLLDLAEFADEAVIAATLGCIAYQGWWIFPYTRPYPNEVKLCARDAPSDDRIRILASNVLATNRNAAGLLALVRQHQPDILITLESNAWWQSQLDVLEAEYPYTIKCPLENLYGMHVYSRLALEDSETRFLVEDDIPSMHTTVVLGSGQRVQVHFLHPTPPSPTENAESAARDVELLVVAKHVSELNCPVIVAGDLNDVAWSSTTRLFRKISGLLDPRVGRGMFNTFHADHWFMRWPLDHLFHSRHFTLSFIKRLPSYGSDHFPVLVELVYDAPAGATQEGLTADAADEKLSEERIAEESAKVLKVQRSSS